MCFLSQQGFRFCALHSPKQGLGLESTRSVLILIEHMDWLSKLLTDLFAWNIQHGLAIWLWKLLWGSEPSGIPCSELDEQASDGTVMVCPRLSWLLCPWAPAAWAVHACFECQCWPCTSCFSRFIHVPDYQHFLEMRMDPVRTMTWCCPMGNCLKIPKSHLKERDSERDTESWVTVFTLWIKRVHLVPDGKACHSQRV